MEQETVNFGETKVKVTPEMKKELDKLRELVRAQEGKKPSFSAEDKKKITQELVTKLQRD